MSKAPTRGKYTLDDWLAQPEDAYLELVDGELIQKAAPTLGHSRGQFRISSLIDGPYGRRAGGPHGPGGWWFGTEPDILLGSNVFRPDVAGWRRDRHAAVSEDFPIPTRPDWICEVLSESNTKHDTIVKLRHYHRAGIDHYWLLDPDKRELTVHRYTPEAYLLVLRADAAERVRAEPFDAIELHVAVLLGDDPED